MDPWSDGNITVGLATRSRHVEFYGSADNFYFGNCTVCTGGSYSTVPPRPGIGKDNIQLQIPLLIFDILIEA